MAERRIMGDRTEPTESQRILEALTQISDKYQRTLAQAIQDRESGWHRLNIKLDGGRVVAVQLQKDQAITID